MPKQKLTQLKDADLKPLREKIHEEQGEICPLLKTKVPYDKVVVDHQHKTATQIAGIDGAGLVRGVIQYQANVMEGKVTNSFRRCGLHKMDITLPEFLRNLADYLEQDNLPLIHPTEAPKPRTFQKSLFNKLNKAYKLKYPKRKPLEYPKGRKSKSRVNPKPPKLTNTWIMLLEEFGLYKS